MRATVFWVDGPWRGRLGIVPRPRGGDWLREETAAWRQAGLDMVVSLLEAQEEAQLELEAEAVASAASGVVFRSFPIPDRGVPASKQAVAALAGDLLGALENGSSVAVHCRQGIGRSGLIVGCVLVARDTDPAAALTAIAKSRGVAVPETLEQREWLIDFASAVQSEGA